MVAASKSDICNQILLRKGSDLASALQCCSCGLFLGHGDIVQRYHKVVLKKAAKARQGSDASAPCYIGFLATLASLFFFLLKQPKTSEVD